MSHYLVAVFTKENGNSVEELLAPYYEGLNCPHYISKNEIIEKVRDEIKRFNDGAYARYLENPEEYKAKCNNNSHIKYITEEFPKMLEWTDDECHAYGTRYYKKENIKPDGSVFEVYNQNSKWDWYQCGGRFGGEIPLKSGDFVNEADMTDVDIEYVDKDEYDKCLRFWELYINGLDPETDDDNELIETVWFNKEYYTERYKDGADYAESCSGFSFYAALLPNFEWLEPGKMGWFAISDASVEDEIAWRSKQKEILKKAQEENWHITIVDCHI